MIKLLEKVLERYKIYQNNILKNKTNIELFSGIKPSSYYVPNILGYLNHPPYSNKDEINNLSWFVEIWINDICIWRKSNTNKEQKNLQQYENKLFEEIIEEILLYGINSCNNDTIKRYENKNT